MAINGIYSDPRVRLKLDPGEFGFSYGTSLARTPSAISAQELGNLIGFRREALVKGLDVDFAQISLTPGLSSSGPTVQSGRTEVKFSDKPGIPQSLAKTQTQQQNVAAQSTTPFTNPLLSALDVARQFVQQFLGTQTAPAANKQPDASRKNTVPVIEHFKAADDLGNVQAFRAFLNETQNAETAPSFFETLRNFLTQFPVSGENASGIFVNSLA